MTPAKPYEVSMTSNARKFTPQQSIVLETLRRGGSLKMEPNATGRGFRVSLRDARGVPVAGIRPTTIGSLVGAGALVRLDDAYALVRLIEDIHAEGDAQNRAAEARWLDLASRPEVGHLVRNGRPIYYAVVNGILTERSSKYELGEYMAAALDAGGTIGTPETCKACDSSDRMCAECKRALVQRAEAAAEVEVVQGLAALDAAIARNGRVQALHAQARQARRRSAEAFDAGDHETADSFTLEAVDCETEIAALNANAGKAR